MRFDDLPAYLSLNRLLNGIDSTPGAVLFLIKPISQKSNSCVTDRPTDGPTDGRTDGRTDTPSYRDARTHLKTRQTENVLRSMLFNRSTSRGCVNKSGKC